MNAANCGRKLLREEEEQRERKKLDGRGENEAHQSKGSEGMKPERETWQGDLMPDLVKWLAQGDTTYWNNFTNPQSNVA